MLNLVIILLFVDLGLKDKKFPQTLEGFGYKFNEGL